jgi:DNA-binding protein YbaB
MKSLFKLLVVITILIGIFFGSVAGFAIITSFPSEKRRIHRPPHKFHNIINNNNHCLLTKQLTTKASSTSSTSSTSTKILLFWKSDNDKQKSEKDDTIKKSPDNNQKQTTTTSKMGTTAMTMENFKQSQELGKKTGSLIQELSSMQVEGVAAKGKIKIFVDGLQQPVGVEIDDEYFKQGSAEEFSDELLIAMQDAHKKSMQIQQDRMQGLYSTLGLPTSK